MVKRYAPDTNFFLQFNKAQELPWNEICTEEFIELILVDEVLHELDRHKAGGNDRRSRRSRDTLQVLRPLLVDEIEEVVVRERSPRVAYRLAPSLPANREKSPLLDLSRSDARIVDEVLACHTLVFDRELTFLTHDSLALKLARSVALPRQPLPDSWRLAPERDSRDDEIAKLRLELSGWEGRAPAIEAEILVAGEVVEKVAGKLPRYKAGSRAFIEEAMNSLLQAHPDEASSMEGFVSVYRPDDLIKYKNERQDWASASLDKLMRYTEVLNYSSCVFPIELVLRNVGSATAEDLVVDVTTEGNIRLVDAVGRTAKSKTLKFEIGSPPRMRRITDVFLDIGARRDDRAFLGMLPKDMPFRISRPLGRDFNWTFEESTASTRWCGECGDFRHQIGRESVALAISVPWNEQADPNGCIRVRYSAKNLLRPVERVWPIRLEYGWRDSQTATREWLDRQLKEVR